jgi:hypothetical protein
MLKFKNAQTLSRTDMKKLMGGTTIEARPACFNECYGDYNTPAGYCANGGMCEQYLCDNSKPEWPRYAQRCV